MHTSSTHKQQSWSGIYFDAAESRTGGTTESLAEWQCFGSNDLLRAQKMLHSAESANQMRRHFRKQRPPCKKILVRGWQEYNVVHRQSPIHHHTHIQSRSGSSYATVTSKSFYSSTWGQACHAEVVSSAFIVKPYLWSCMKYKRPLFRPCDIWVQMNVDLNHDCMRSYLVE